MKNFLKAVVGVTVFGLSSVALAGGGGMAPPFRDSGWYIGGGLGFGLSHWDNVIGHELEAESSYNHHENDLEDIIIPAVILARVGKEDGFAARAKIGYIINHFYSTEFGFVFLPSAVTVNGSGKIRNWAIDWTGILTLAVMDQFGVFARLGIDYLVSTVTSALALRSPLPGGATRVRNFNVTFGAGAYYDYNEQLRFLLEWQRFHGKARMFYRKYQPFMDIFTLGVSLRLPEKLLT